MLEVLTLFNCHLKTILENRGMSQAFLARKMGVSTQTMNAWVADRAVPSMKLAYKVAEFLECEVTDIWEYVKEE